MKDNTEVKEIAFRLGIMFGVLALLGGTAESPYRDIRLHAFTVVTLALSFLLIWYSKSSKATD